MTMQIKGGRLIAGLEAKTLRDFLRKFRCGFNRDVMATELKLTASQVSRIVRELVRENFIVPDPRAGPGTRWYYPAKKGEELIRASAAAQITRKTAQRALAGLMERIQAVNANSRYLCSITKAVVFGSFLRNVERLGDVDIAVEIQYRVPRDQNLWKVIREYGLASGRDFPTFDAQQSWPVREVMLVLKARKRTLRIESWFSFKWMEKEPNFNYEVLLGDIAEIRRDLEEAERERRGDSTREHSRKFRQR